MTSEQKQMFKKMLLLGFGATLLITGICILFMAKDSLRDLFTEMKKPYDALEADLDDLKPGDHVTVDVVLCSDYVLKRTESLGKGNTVSYSSERRYYPAIVLGEKDGHYIVDHMVLVSTDGKVKNMNKAVEAFESWWNGETDEMPTKVVYSVDGRVAKLKDDELKLLKEYFGDDDYRDYTVPYVVKPLWDEWGGKRGSGLSMVITCLVVSALGAFMLFRGLRVGKKKAKAAAPATQAPVAQTPVYQNPQYQAPTPTVDQNPPYQGQTQNNDQNPPTQG